MAENALVSNIKQTATRQAKYALLTLAHMVANVLGYRPVYEAGDFGKEGTGALAVARPEPLFDWFIPSDGDGVHLGTHTAERPPTFAYLRKVRQTPERLGFHAFPVSHTSRSVSASARRSGHGCGPRLRRQNTAQSMQRNNAVSHCVWYHTCTRIRRSS